MQSNLAEIKLPRFYQSSNFKRRDIFFNADINIDRVGTCDRSSWVGLPHLLEPQGEESISLAADRHAGDVGQWHAGLQLPCFQVCQHQAALGQKEDPSSTLSRIARPTIKLCSESPHAGRYTHCELLAILVIIIILQSATIPVDFSSGAWLLGL